MAPPQAGNLETMNNLFRFSSIVMVILFAYILTFLIKLERTGCECAYDWRRGYILTYSVYMIALGCLQFVAGFHPIMRMMYPINLALGLLFVIFSLQYVHRLEKEKCSCSERIGRVILFIVAAVDAAVYAIIGLLIVLAALSFALKSKW